MRRTGIGEVLPACTDVVPGLLPQPAIFRIFTVICNGLPPGVTVSIKPCRNPMIFTSPGGIVMAVELSMIGKAAMDRLVEASCPENGPLWAVICIGPLGKLVLSMVSLAGSLTKQLAPARPRLRTLPRVIVVSTYAFVVVPPQEYALPVELSWDCPHSMPCSKSEDPSHEGQRVDVALLTMAGWNERNILRDLVSNHSSACISNKLIGAFLVCYQQGFNVLQRDRNVVPRCCLRIRGIVGLRLSRGRNCCGGPPPDTSKEDRQASPLEGHSNLGVTGIRCEIEAGRANQDRRCASDLILRKNCVNSGSRHVLSQGL